MNENYENSKERLQLLQTKVQRFLGLKSTQEKEQALAAMKVKQLDTAIASNIKVLTPLLKKIKQLEMQILPWKKLQQASMHLIELLELGQHESSLDDEYSHAIESQLLALEKQFQQVEHERLFNANDALHAYISINAGAGGREACDWAGLLYRMYQRWAERRNFNFRPINAISGEESGIKSAEALIEGKFVYGELKNEAGVHRLVRISPFDSAKRRHTSFASIAITADIKHDIGISIKASDIRIDTYRASGAGGQHVNTTDSAVRITHLASSIAVSCQAERSQFQNKERAMKLLKARLYEKSLAEKKSQLKNQQKTKKKIEWGSQIRSYIFHPYQMVKDHRTKMQTSALQNVLDGDINAFIKAALDPQDQ